jgi:hypothetical protein
MVASVARALDDGGGPAVVSRVRDIGVGTVLSDILGHCVSLVGLPLRGGIHADLLDELLLPGLAPDIPSDLDAGSPLLQSGCLATARS